MTEKRRLTLSELLCAICFALCFFAFMLTEAFVNERCAELLGSAAVTPVYSLGLVCTGVGFLSFSLFRRICGGEKARRAALLLIGALCLAAAAALLTADRLPGPFAAKRSARWGSGGALPSQDGS